jgi:hypothetical protein
MTKQIIALSTVAFLTTSSFADSNADIAKQLEMLKNKYPLWKLN